MTVKCTTNGKEAVNCTDAIHGTMARFSCGSFYENSRLSMLPAICLDGRWSEEAPSCIPTCGKTSALRDPTLIINGQDATLEDFPWQVALYRLKDKELLCGGSLLNARMILTAAHCITDSQGHLLPKEDYVGKNYRNFDDSRDSSHKQTSSIHEIFVPEQYQGFDQNYLADIALIATVKSFTLTAWVQPVCIDWQKNYDRLILDEKKKGVVSGWGYTRETGNSSEALRNLELSVVPKKKCEKEVPEDFARYLTYDKLCAGYLNHSTSVCLGDSGGGLVFKYQDRYYIGGVVSSSPITDTPERGCNSQQYSLYTFVYNYTDIFILRNMLRFESSDVNCDGCLPETGCTLPKDLATKIANGSVVQERNALQHAAYVGERPTNIFCSGVLLNEKVLLTMRICVSRGSRKEDYKIARDLFYPYNADYTDLGDILVIEDTAFIVVKKTFKTEPSLGKTCDWINIYPRGTLNQAKHYVFISNYVDKDGKSWDMLQGKHISFQLRYFKT
ncbi:venom serine protease Bi-VSP-like [Tenebrio molitor]|uniref:venom serine protease Bi-VSP-like n=1 Tax=Tenebrio molitor TaxID=7067 RepID=UPI0036248E69